MPFRPCLPHGHWEDFKARLWKVSDTACSALQVDRELWARASRTALDRNRELPIKISGISDDTLGEWVFGMLEAYEAAGLDSIRGVHACFTEVLAPLHTVACLSFDL